MGTKSSVFEKMDFQLKHLEMEFEDETWWFWSTHEYSKTTKFHLQTPSLSVSTGNPFFQIHYFWCPSVIWADWGTTRSAKSWVAELVRPILDPGRFLQPQNGSNSLQKHLGSMLDSLRHSGCVIMQLSIRFQWYRLWVLATLISWGLFGTDSGYCCGSRPFWARCI